MEGKRIKPLVTVKIKDTEEYIETDDPFGLQQRREDAKKDLNAVFDGVKGGIDRKTGEFTSSLYKSLSQELDIGPFQEWFWKHGDSLTPSEKELFDNLKEPQYLK